MIIFSDTLILVYSIVIAGILGAVFGSFLNCAAYRIAHGESVVKGRSHCPDCGHELGVLDLFPIFSWLFLRGKCRYCKSKVSSRYFITECIMALMSILCLLACDISFLFLRNFILLCCLFCLSLIDIDTFEIPDRFHIIMIVAWALYLLCVPDVLETLKKGGLGFIVIGGGILIISLIMDKVLGKNSLGGGDIKLLFVMGLYLGLVAGVFALIFACIIGLIFAVATKKRKEHFPFGPSISIAFWFMLLYGDGLTNWYLGLLGL